MDTSFQEKLLDAFMSDYQRVYLVDLLENQIFMQVNSDRSNEEEIPWMQAAIDPTVSFDKFIEYYSEYSVEESHREWFAKQMSPENIRNTLHGRNSFIIACPLVSGDWRRIEVRRFDDTKGIAATVLICIPFSSVATDMERYMPGDVTLNNPEPREHNRNDGSDHLSSEFDRNGSTQDKTAGKSDGRSAEIDGAEGGTSEQSKTGMKATMTATGRQSLSDNIVTFRKGAVSTCKIDVTDFRFLEAEFDMPDVFYPVPEIPEDAEFDAYLNPWIDRIISDNREDFRMLMSREYLLRCYELGTREPWIEYKVRDRFGNEVWLGEKALLTKDETTGHIMCLVVIRNITDQVATRAENERRMNLIEGLSAEYSSVYFVDLPKDKYFIYRLSDHIRKRFEKGFCESFTDSMEYFLENGVYSFDRDNVREKLLSEGVRKNLVGRRDYSFIFRALTSEGPKYYRCMVVRIDKNEGEATEALVGFADVHEEQENSMRQKQLLESALEQARNAGKAKTMFLSNMSHDIRTPMNAIMGLAELAKLHPDDVETVEDSLNKILTSGEHLLKLINNVLDLSRIESGRMILKEEPCSLREEINEAMNIFRSQMKARNIEYVQYIDDDVVDLIFCDSLKMRQLVINIVSNSVKYTRPGGRIELKIENAEAPEGYAGILFRVKDNGIGMSPSFIKKIYEPFEREESSAISQVAGSGLGMPICKAIVDAMGGTITVASEQDKGTEISVHLEFRLQDSSIKEEPSADASEHIRYRIFNRPVHKSIAKKQFRILLVEDNRLNREIAGKMLKHLGHETIMCESGDKAVEVMRDAGDDDYDLILMDVHMPGMSGYEATEKIRSAGGMKTWIPIVAMTADAFESDVQHAFRAGMNAFISKPVNLGTLKTVIERFIGKPSLPDGGDKAKQSDEDGKAKLTDGGDKAKADDGGCKAKPSDGGDK